jgi:uncharacterized damage-inducible protein DinB
MLHSIQSLLEYSDAMNTWLLDAASKLQDAQLDQTFPTGMGTLRRTLIHIYTAEAVWLQRWMKNGEQKWLDEKEAVSMPELKKRFEKLWAVRDEFIADVEDEEVFASQSYRDSKGSLFKADLHDMLLQGVVHSIHHRAQASGMLKQLGAEPIDLDYMYWVRQPT